MFSLMSFTDPYTSIIGGGDVFIDQHSSVNLTCVVHSPEMPDHVFWLRKKSVISTSSGNSNSQVMCIMLLKKIQC